MAKTTKPVRLELSVEARTIVGKGVKKLRREGKLPANVYGEDFASQSVTVDRIEFTKVYRHAKETGVITVHVDGKDVPVLIQNTQKHPLSGNILHVDFRKVNLKKKIEASVPFLFVGESEAATKKGGDLITQTTHLTVEALPDDLPESIEIDLTKLVEVGDEIKISDLPKNAAYEVMDEPEKVIVRVNLHVEESVEPDLESAIPEVEGEAAAEGEEGAAEGEQTPAAEGEAAEEPAKE